MWSARGVVQQYKENTEARIGFQGPDWRVVLPGSDTFDGMVNRSCKAEVLSDIAATEASDPKRGDHKRKVSLRCSYFFISIPRFVNNPERHRRAKVIPSFASNMTSHSASQVSWQAIAKRKQAYRDSQIPQQWKIPSNMLPKDPPLMKYGPQNVLHVPRECGLLSPTEVTITETHSVESLLSALSTRKLSALEVTTAFCKRTAIAQQLTNCVTEPLFSTAIHRAKELDESLARKGQVVGPLHGLPVSVKDSLDVIGVDSSTGIASLCFKPVTINSPLIDLLLSLGCVIIAKTNVPQTLNSLDSINNVFGRTLNPINRLYTAGGSSGGEGVIMAMRGSMVGWGADTGGSIRVPAMCNGIFGIKSSNGRVPAGGGPLISNGGISRCTVPAVVGPLARSIEDIDFVMREVVPRAWM